MNITELKELAEKATGGEWVVGSSPFDQSRHVYCKSPVTDGEESWLPLIASTDDGETLVDHEANAAYYAAANPAAILELIAAHEDAQGEIRALRATEQALREMVKALEFGLSEVATLMDESEGVAGLHLNGDVAPWSELRSGGRFEAWLLGFDEARALLEQKP